MKLWFYLLTLIPLGYFEDLSPFGGGGGGGAVLAPPPPPPPQISATNGQIDLKIWHSRKTSQVE